jgi:hypothetical protein
MHTEIRYGTVGAHGLENGLWIDLAVARVPVGKEAEVRLILDRARDELVAALGLSDDPGS